MLHATQLLSSVLQRANITNQKQLELLPGQVVRGTVLKQYPDQMALVQIGGVQVLAKLEANLEAGQKAWLQVQPNADPVSLKVVTSPDNPSAAQEGTISGLLRSLGIADTQEARTLVLALLKQNMPIHKEQLNAFLEIAKHQDVSDALVSSFLLAAKRGLPLTNQAVTSIQAFLSGQPITQTIKSLIKEAELFLARGQSTEPFTDNSDATEQLKKPASLQQTVAALKEKLASLPLALHHDMQRADQKTDTGLFQTAKSNQGGTGQLLPDTTISASDAAQKGTAISATPVTKLSPGYVPILQSEWDLVALDQSAPIAEEVQTRGSLPPAGEQSNPPADSTRQKTNFAPTTADQTFFPQANLVENSSVAAKPKIALPQGITFAASQPMELDLAAELGKSPLIDRQKESSIELPAMSVADSAVTEENEKGNMIKEFFRQMGMMHERNLSPHVVFEAENHLVEKQLSSIKSLLLQVVQGPSNQLPVALREAADTLLQQVTGQQLLLSPPPSESISHLIMQLPLRTEQGENTAFIQIESKKKEGGQLDAENCRLFFQLDLKNLGMTMVDVNIVNRIINVSIFNDIPALDRMVMETKDMFSEQLHQVGYHLSSLRVQPVPTKQTGETKAPVLDHLMSQYKGVDIRI